MDERLGEGGRREAGEDVRQERSDRGVEGRGEVEVRVPEGDLE